MKLTLVTGPNRFFGQSRKPWVSLRTELLTDELRRLGYEVELLEFHQLANQPGPHGETIFYTFSQRDHLRGYIKDVMTNLAAENRLIPSLELLLCHENKGYAELYRRKLGINEPRGWYLSSLDEAESYDIPYPLVLKDTSGTNAKGVYLCRDRDELRANLRRLSGQVSLTGRLDHLRRKHLRSGRRYPGYPDFEAHSDADAWLDYMTPGSAFVLQEFVPDLDCDYRVIAVGDRFYVMKRMVNKADFRASGTKKFVFDFDPPDGLLYYAQKVFRSFHTPYLSMDIGERQGKYYLFEFQALHFGTAAIVRSSGFYLEGALGWRFTSQPSVLESTLAGGLDGWLKTEVT